MSGRTLLGLLLVGFGFTPGAVASSREDEGLYPPAEPIKSGYLKVDDVHEIFYYVFGNPPGQPAIVLHGGPGYGSYPRLMRYFDPDKFMIILHDQRGAGRSKPAGELRANTTQHLVEDIERLRGHLGVERKALVFGGSWGSTLALAYAEKYPQHVSGMVLRGVFTGTRAERENVFGDGAPQKFFPDAVARMEQELPEKYRNFEPEELLEVFTGSDEALSKSVAAAWIRYATKTGKLHATDEEVERGWGDFDTRPGARIDCHYAANGFFLEDGQLLRDAPRLKNIAITLINGRYDMVCPPVMAWRLHQALPKSKLIIVEQAGHSEGEPGTTRALLRAVAEFE